MGGRNGRTKRRDRVADFAAFLGVNRSEKQLENLFATVISAFGRCLRTAHDPETASLGIRKRVEPSDGNTHNSVIVENDFNRHVRATGATMYYLCSHCVVDDEIVAVQNRVNVAIQEPVWRYLHNFSGHLLKSRDIYL